MKQIMRPTVAAVAVIAALGIAGISQAQSSTASTQVNKTKASELVGYELAARYPEWARQLIDPQAVGRAVTRALEGQKPSMSQTEAEGVAKAFGAQYQALGQQHYEQVSAANKKAGDEYLAQNKNKPGVRVTQDGLQYQIISQGTGPRPKSTDTVEVNYTGSFVNGQVFDASKLHGDKPAKLSLQNMIPGFREALMLMPAGSHYKFVIPSNLAYGSKPQNPAMPPNATLVFDITLVKIGG